MEIDEETHMDTSQDEIDGTHTFSEESQARPSQTISAQPIIIEGHNDCQVSENQTVSDNYADNVSEINFSTGNCIQTDNDPVTIAIQNDNIIDVQAPELSINLTTDTNRQEDDSSDVFTPDADHSLQIQPGLNTEESRVTEPTSTPLFSQINAALEDQIQAVNDESHSLRRTQQNYVNSSYREGQVQSGDSVCDGYSAPPPDYAEYVIMEYYRNKGLVCCGSQTITNTCFCSCHSFAGRETFFQNGQEISINLAQTVYNGSGSQHFSYSPMSSQQQVPQYGLGNPETIQRTNQNDKTIKFLFWCFMIFLVVAGVLFGIVAASVY